MKEWIASVEDSREPSLAVGSEVIMKKKVSSGATCMLSGKQQQACQEASEGTNNAWCYTYSLRACRVQMQCTICRIGKSECGM